MKKLIIILAMTSTIVFANETESVILQFTPYKATVVTAGTFLKLEKFEHTGNNFSAVIAEPIFNLASKVLIKKGTVLSGSCNIDDMNSHVNFKLLNNNNAQGELMSSNGYSTTCDGKNGAPKTILLINPVDIN